MSTEKGTKTPRGRFFAAVSYIADTAELCDILQRKTNSIRAYALILHDKDEADLHHHMVIRTHSTWTCPQIAKWFADNKDGQNTLVQLVKDRSAIIDYLTHENDDDKHRYDKSDIIDGGIDDILPAGETSDDSFEIIEKLLAGTSVREMVRLYGREFVYHYGNYATIANAIREEENP